MCGGTPVPGPIRETVPSAADMQKCGVRPPGMAQASVPPCAEPSSGVSVRGGRSIDPVRPVAPGRVGQRRLPDCTVQPAVGDETTASVVAE